MAITNDLQVIASESAQIAVEKFLQTLPNELLDQLPQHYIDDIGTTLQTDIQDCIQSRLRWSEQSARAELLEQNREESQSKSLLHDQINFSPPQPIQRLSPKGLKSCQQPSQNEIKQPVALENPVNEELETTGSRIEPAQAQLILKKSPNHQKRRRRRSAAAEYEESLLNST